MLSGNRLRMLLLYQATLFCFSGRAEFGDKGGEKAPQHAYGTREDRPHGAAASGGRHPGADTYQGEQGI